MKNYVHIFAKWLERKANEKRRKRIFEKYGLSKSLGHNPALLTNEQQIKAFGEAYIETGDTRCLIDYFQLRSPRDNRYFEKAFRKGLIMSVFRRYDDVRAMLIEYWYEILCLEEQKEYQEIMLKKYFGGK